MTSPTVGPVRRPGGQFNERLTDYRIISADDHIDMPWLPKELWQRRVPAQWRELAPKVIDTADGPHRVCGEEPWGAWGCKKGAWR